MNTLPNNSRPIAPDPLAVALAKLDPAPHGFEWNAMMFAAGRASKARALALWRGAAVLAALAACAFGYAYFTRPPILVERERIIYLDPSATDRSPPPVLPAHGPGPVRKPDPRLPSPPVPVSDQPGWTFDAGPLPGTAATWFKTRNEILSVGLSMLPDLEHKVPSPSSEK
jgi:hypothetical protein